MHSEVLNTCVETIERAQRSWGWYEAVAEAPGSKARLLRLRDDYRRNCTA